MDRVMKIKDREFETFIDEAELGAIVARLAGEVSHDYQGKRLVVCPILTGAYMFAADLVRRLHAEGLFVNVWTVNDSTDIQRMIDFGVDCITTNEPLRVRGMLGKNEDVIK